MPDSKNFDIIERIIREVGERELETGMLPEPEEGEKEAFAPPEGGEEEAAAGAAEPLTEVLRDIEAGLSEEKELEEKLRTDEEDFGLPLDFDMADLNAEEESPVRGSPVGEAGEPPAVEKPVVEKPGRAAPGRKAPAVEEPAAESGPLAEFESELRELEEQAAAEIPPGTFLEEEPPETPPAEAEFVLPDIEEAGDFEKESAGFPDLETAVSRETPPAGEETASPPATGATAPDLGVFEFPEFEELSAEQPTGLPETGRVEVPPEVEAPAFREEEQFREAAPEEKGPPERAPSRPQPAPGEEDMELSDEDIILVKTKLTQLPAYIAARVRDIIVDAALSTESMKGLLSLLTRDAPEGEIVQYVEWATGKKVAPRKRVPAAPAAPRPRPFEAITENIGPFVRVAGLFAAILAVFGALIFIFVWNPLRANKYYRLGISQVRAENYRGAEESFAKALSIKEKTREFDNFGWEYMKTGNYDEAEKKFTEGISREKTKPAWKRTVGLRLHRAQLYAILGRFAEADVDYREAITLRPEYYPNENLRGRNLIEWGRSLMETGEKQPEQLETAYNLFRDSYAKNRRNSDPLFQMLAIELLRRNEEHIRYYRDLLASRFPQAVNRDVHTDLAAYFVERGEPEEAWRLLAPLVKRYPDSPRAYFILSLYFKSIDKRVSEERALETVVAKERERKLQYPWETRDMRLISDAYNNMGEIHARTEIAGQYAEAVDLFKRAVEADDTNTKAYFNLGQAYFYGERDFALARWNYEKAKALGWKDDDLTYNLGAVYFYAGEFESALRQWAPLSEVFPDNPNIGFALGTVFLYLKKYQSSLGELLRLSEFYERSIEELGPIKPYNPYHRRLLLNGASVYNNIGVSYQKLYESAGRRGDFQKDALVSLYRGGELADLAGEERGRIQYNIQYIMHPKVIRGDMAVDPGISENYRFTIH